MAYCEKYASLYKTEKVQVSRGNFFHSGDHALDVDVNMNLVNIQTKGLTIVSGS